MQVAMLMADGARAKAVAANRAGDYALARVVLRTAIEAIRVLAPTLPRVQAVADALEEEIVMFEQRMDQMTMKSTHFMTHNAMSSRTVQGRSRRKTGAK